MDWTVSITSYTKHITTREEKQEHHCTRTFQVNHAWEAVLAAGRAGLIPAGDHKIEVRERVVYTYDPDGNPWPVVPTP